jgi:transposase
VHRQWFLESAMDQLLDCDFAAADKDRLYRCLDRVVAHKHALCRHLVDRWKTLFDARFDILLYDLTSTYFEGQSQQIPKARHGYSRDGPSDCRQVVIALVVTTDGLPLAYEVLAGNRSDKTTLSLFLQKIQSMYGKARRVWIMDRGIPTEATLKQMRDDQVAYLVGTPKALLSKLEKQLADQPWEQVHEGMKVKLLEQDGELYIQAASDQWPMGMEKQAPVLWKWYMQLVRVEEAFKTLKGELGLRPIHHQLQKRVEAHIRVAFLGYCLSSSLRMKLAAAAPGLTPRAVLACLSAIQMLEVQIPTTDGRVLVMPRYTEPEAQQKMILEVLKLALPPQPPPRIRAGKIQLPDARSDTVL